MPDKPAKVPPMPVVRAIARLRAGLQSLHRSTAPPSVALLELATGAWTTQTMYVAANLGVADQLAGGPARAADIAPRVGADPDALYRLMRALASKGLLRHRRNDSFALTKVGEALRSDMPGSMRDMVLFIGHQARWEDSGNLLHSVQTGEPSVLELRGMPYWDYLETNPELAQVFNDAMTATSGMTNEIALSAYGSSDFKLSSMSAAATACCCPPSCTARRARTGCSTTRPQSSPAPTPCSRPPGWPTAARPGAARSSSGCPMALTYVMKNIIHDWDDDSSLAILRNIRTAIAPNGKLLLLEMVLPERTTSFIGYQLDLEMLVTVGGRERTRTDYAKLLSRADFRLDRVVDTVTPLSIVEASPV